MAEYAYIYQIAGFFILLWSLIALKDIASTLKQILNELRSKK